MKNITNKHKSNKNVGIWIWLLLGSGILIRLWLTESQPLFVKGGAIYDDRLFLTLAKNILEGKWLGPYNSLTLIKGPFFPVWIAVANFLGMPLLLAGHIFYASSCLILAHSLKPIIGNKYQFVILYFLLLFNPAGFDSTLTRATREMIYPSLTIIVVACTFGIFFSSSNNTRTWHWGIGFGIAMGCFWLTREEGIWVFPFLLFIFIAAMVLIGFRNWSIHNFWIFIKPCLISFATSMLILNAINTLNYVNYGIYAKTEMDASSFKAAYGALSRVKPEVVKRYIPVTKATRNQIYKISPSFKELADYLEGPMGQMWVEQGNGAGRIPSNRTEILGGWFIWAFRAAVANSGYYDLEKFPDEYFHRFADEINHACEIKQLDCLSERTTLSPVWHWSYAKYLIPSMIQRILALVKFESISVAPIISDGSREQLVLFQNLTNEEILSPNLSSDNVSLYTKDQRDILRIAILRYILRIYQTFIPILIIFSVIAFIILLFLWMKKRACPPQLLVLISLLILIFTRITLLSLIDVTSWQLNALAYLHPLHPFLLIFVFLVMIESVKYFRAILNNQTKGNK